MKEGFTFTKVSLMFLRKVIFKNFGGGGKTEKSLVFHYFSKKIGGAEKSLHLHPHSNELMKFILQSVFSYSNCFFRCFPVLLLFIL